MSRLEELEAGSKVAGQLACEIMAVAIGGCCDAAVIGMGPYDLYHSLAAVKILAKYAEQMKQERDKYKEQVEFERSKDSVGSLQWLVYRMEERAQIAEEKLEKLGVEIR